VSGAFDPVDFLERAVRTPSHEDVTEMRALLVETLVDAGFDPVVDDAGNTLATRGSGSPHVVLNTHVDTVPPHVAAERRDGVLAGRGSCDAKGPLAAMLDAFLAVGPDAGRLTLAVTPDEEVYSTGAAALDLRELDGVGERTADAYVVGEPTGLDVCTAARGRFEATVRLAGRNAHAAEPASGVNAVAGAEGALRAIRGFDAGRSPHESLGAPTLTPTVIEGGAATNQVPADCAITVDRRSVPPESAEEFRAGLADAVRAATPEGIGVDVSLTDRPTPFLEAFATDADADVVVALADAASEATNGAGGAVRPFGAATEASYFAPTPTVVFGPGVLADDEGPVAHADREYVRLADVERAATALTDALDRLV
jgi:acetylornithine deacetylase